MQVKVQVVTITDEGQEITREVACVERQDLTPVTLGLSLAEGKAVLQALQEVVVEWQMEAYLRQQRTARSVARRSATQGPASHGVSHRLWGALGRESSTLSLCVSGPRDAHVQSPGRPCCPNGPPRSYSSWKPSGRP